MLHLSVYSIEKKLFEGEADSLALPGIDGELGVLSMHEPLITSLKHGTMSIRRGTTIEKVAIGGGFVEIQPESKVVVLAN